MLQTESFCIVAPATAANLGPGFDCLALALDLYNTVEVQPVADGEGISVEVYGEGAGLLERDQCNMVLMAMLRLAETAGLPLPPLHLRQTNAIPLGRGLGSSAAAIAAGLLAAARLLGLPIDPEALLPVALSLESHPDNIAAALWGGFTIGILDGDSALVRRMDAPARLRAVVLLPDRFASTREARAVLPASVSRADAIFNSSRCALLVADLLAGRFEALHIAMADRLHQPQRAQTFPYLHDAISAAVGAGAHGAALSGAGSSVIALVSSGEEQVATALAEVAQRHGVQARTLILAPAARGTHVIPRSA